MDFSLRLYKDAVWRAAAAQTDFENLIGDTMTTTMGKSPWNATHRHRLLPWYRFAGSCGLTSPRHIVSRGLPAVVVFAVLGLVPAFNAAAQDRQVVSVDEANFEEERLPRLPVSGGVRAGVLAGALDRAVAPEGLTILVPDESQGRLCVEIHTIDGTYRARFWHAFRDLPAGPVSFNFPTRQKDAFNGRVAEEIAVRAYKANDCRGRPAYFLPAAWSNAEDWKTVNILVNSGRSRTSLSVPKADGTSVSIQCNASQSDNRVSYDTVCPLEMTAGLDPTRIHIRRRFGSEVSPPVALRLRIP